jgi:peptidoglycan/xylan/chitin deacetylase (PgdA/CDA1 family)
MLRVLAYHRIADPSSASMLDPRLISATQDTFELQMAYLASGYHVVSMEDVLNAIEGGSRLPEKAVLITFDDAYVDFAANAWPILKRYRLPVTVFVPTAYPDQPERSFWWDRLYRAFFHTPKTELSASPLGPLSLKSSEERRYSLRKLQIYMKSLAHQQAMALTDEVCSELGIEKTTYKSTLSWGELRQLARDGVTLGAHTQTHPILTQLEPRQIRAEVAGSQQDLKREIGRVLPVFCYPNGNCNDMVIDILREEGFVAAFTMQSGHNDLRCADHFRLCRTSINKRTSPLVFRLRLLPLFGYIDRWRNRNKSKISSAVSAA